MGLFLRKNKNTGLNNNTALSKEYYLSSPELTKEYNGKMLNKAIGKLIRYCFIAFIIFFIIDGSTLKSKTLLYIGLAIDAIVLFVVLNNFIKKCKQANENEKLLE